MRERYESAAVEAEARQFWDKARCFEAKEDSTREKYIACPCSHIQAAACTWDMSAITPSATYLSRFMPQ